ncbi:sigma-54-dependent transcriptional regulator [Clostridium vincentii]|uniref:Arginine utilization regulatory protein RocR n=1 Tax=Clostridium vincentii TaxID=52704 RepID=A0A2T0BCP9_9CLOT|nr:sigma-54-dependent transcriptional regulator [Clostridium vincentii]PRR81587.1 Arginine utilization regulatory protein RocR [Clostridium vincentii]
MKCIDIIMKKLVELNYVDGIDAKTLSELLDMSRANVSHELNALYKEGKVNKSSGRPVLFFLETTSSLSNPLAQLDQLYENNISLNDAVKQAKAAILYPPNGMNCLILGETGVGKSMFASLMYDYATAMNMKPKGSPFITFNCADYCNNPQLLTSQLFGVKKGAYTGCDVDKEGLIEQANGGILFLDEVHRLPPEGQEALFIFLDSNKFRRLGDSESRTSDVLIIAATTENPDSTLLNTFTRRIPIVITIPALSDRTFEERLYLIKNFFKYESVRLNQEVYVSLNSIRALLSYNCSNNIGQLKNDIQLICAKAYSEFLTNSAKDVRISSRSLPPYIKEGLYKEREHRVLWNTLVGEEIEYFKFSGTSKEGNQIFNTGYNHIYDFIERKLAELKSQSTSDVEIENILDKDISKYFQKHISGVSDELNRKNLLTIVDNDILKCADEVMDFITTHLNRSFTDIYTPFVLHINTLVNRIYNKKTIINPHLSRIKELYPNEFSVALEAKTIIESYINRPIPMDEAGYLTLFLVPEHSLENENTDRVKIILIAHGESTATSIADVANRLLGEDYVIAINAPLDIAPSAILENLKKVVKENASAAGYLLLVDMGSLTTFADVIQKEFNVNIKVISLVSTLHVLEATRKALLGSSLESIYKDVLMVNSYIETHKNALTTTSNNRKMVIITACLTGEGGSVAIKSFLNSTLRYDKNLFEIIPLTCLNKNSFKQEILSIQKENEILFIISSFPVDINLIQYSMNDVFNMSIMNKIQKIVDMRATMLSIPQIIDENIKNIDANKLFNDVITFLKELTDQIKVELSEEITIGLILHLSFVIGRLKNNTPLTDYPHKRIYISDNIDLYNIVKPYFENFCQRYNVDSSDDEICYIINFFLKD